MTIRDYRATDLDSLVELDRSSAAEWRSAFERARFGPERNVLVIEADGAPAGFASIWQNRESPENRHYLEYRLPPMLMEDRRFLDRLLDRLEDRLDELAQEYDGPRQSRVQVPDSAAELAEAFERHGYRLARYRALLKRTDLDGLAEPAWPEGVSARLLDAGVDDEDYVRCYNRSRAGEFEHQPLTPLSFRDILKSPYFQAGLWFVAERAGRMVGSCESYIPAELGDGSRWGVVADLGVVPEERGRGIGRALLRQSMSALRGAGAGRLRLWVDSANPSGARRLYRSEGFEVHSVSRTYVRDCAGRV